MNIATTDRKFNGLKSFRWNNKKALHEQRYSGLNNKITGPEGELNKKVDK